MIVRVFLVINRSGVDRMLKNEAKAAVGEYVVPLRLDIPDALFAKPAVPTVEIKLTRGNFIAPTVTVGGEDVPQNPTREARRYLTALEQLAVVLEKAQASDDPAQTITADVFRRPSSDPQAWLVDGQQTVGAGGETIAMRDGQSRALTVPASVAKGMPRAWLEQGRVVAMTVQALSRFQSFPDSFQWPAKRSLASTCIGNAVPPLLAQRVCESLREAM